MSTQSNVCACGSCTGNQCKCRCQIPTTRGTACARCGQVCNCAETCSCKVSWRLRTRVSRGAASTRD